MRSFRLVATVAALFAVAAAAPALSAVRLHRAISQASARKTPLKHIIVVIQENRTVDNLFNGFCINSSICANTVAVDPVTNTVLQPASLAAPFDPSHSHDQFVLQYDNGLMDGFPKSKVGCEKHKCGQTVFVYVPASENAIYRQLATVDGELSDMTFEAPEGPSFPAHLYAIAGQSGGYDDDHEAIDSGTGNCASSKTTAHQIDMTTPFPGKPGPRVIPCKDFSTIFDLLAANKHSWRYYSNNPSSFQSPTQVIHHLYNSPNFITPSTKFLTDIGSGNLADVTFVMPWNESVSDHPGKVPASNPLAGPQWIAQVMNAVGSTPFWSNTAIVIWWDDWGGLYDHVVPPKSPVSPDPFEYSFRVPLLVASPYARIGQIDHTPRTFVSALRLIEETFNLPSLGTIDQYEPDGLDSMFDFTKPPTPYTPLGGSMAQPFRHMEKS
jgi:phospholipase C